MAELSEHVQVDARHHSDVSLLRVGGVLDSATYRPLRDGIIKAALDEPRAVIVDVNHLSVPAESAWSVFTSARWHVSTWPDVPIVLVCEQPERQQTIERVGVTRYVPVYPSARSARDAVGELSLHGRRRGRAQLPAVASSVTRSRALVAAWLTAWGKTELIPVAGTVATVFVENVLAHTHSAPVMIVELYRDAVTVAVEDGSPLPAGRHEDADHGAEMVSGLAIVSALCRSWSSTPTSSGKTVWAVVGRENQL